MFENRIKGASLAKRISYAYLVIGIILIIAGFALQGYDNFYLGSIFYILMFVVIYFLSTKFSENRYA